MPITKANLENWFSYHAPDVNQLLQYQAIREAAMQFAEVIVENTPPSADQTAAVRKVREATMTANQSLMLVLFFLAILLTCVCLVLNEAHQ